MLEVTLIILNLILITMMLTLMFLGYRFYKKYGKKVFQNMNNLMTLNQRMLSDKNTTQTSINPYELISSVMKQLHKK